MNPNQADPTTGQHLLDEEIGPTQQYPLLLDRYQSLFIDIVILIILMVIAANLLDKMENPPSWVRIALFFGIWLIYEPVLTTFACTPGQFIKGIRVRKESDRSKKIGFFPALIRYIIKTVLGWISFLTIHSNPEKRAIHDLASGSVMIKK